MTSLQQTGHSSNSAIDPKGIESLNDAMLCSAQISLYFGVTFHTDNTKVVGNGRIDESIVIEADTANTATVNLIAKSYSS